MADYRKKQQKCLAKYFYQELRKEHQSCDFKNQFCLKCPDWKNTSWPYDQNKSYADLVERVLYEESNQNV